MKKLDEKYYIQIMDENLSTLMTPLHPKLWMKLLLDEIKIKIKMLAGLD
jgi:hypothetical protein